MQRESYPPSSGAVLLVPWQDLLTSIFQILSTCPSAIAGTFNDYLFYLQTFFLSLCVYARNSHTLQKYGSQTTTSSLHRPPYLRNHLYAGRLCVHQARQRTSQGLSLCHLTTRIPRLENTMLGLTWVLGTKTQVPILTWQVLPTESSPGPRGLTWMLEPYHLVGEPKRAKSMPLSWAAIAKKQQVCIQETRACFLQSVKNSEADPYERAPCMIRLSVALMGCS